MCLLQFKECQMVIWNCSENIRDCWRHSKSGPVSALVISLGPIRFWITFQPDSQKYFLSKNYAVTVTTTHSLCDVVLDKTMPFKAPLVVFYTLVLLMVAVPLSWFELVIIFWYITTVAGNQSRAYSTSCPLSAGMGSSSREKGWAFKVILTLVQFFGWQLCSNLIADLWDHIFNQTKHTKESEFLSNQTHQEWTRLRILRWRDVVFLSSSLILFRCILESWWEIHLIKNLVFWCQTHRNLACLSEV